ncbi:MAG: ATP-binding protein [Pseudomonadales bacterium]
MSVAILVNIVCIAVITANALFMLSRWAPQALSPWLQFGVTAPFLFSVGNLGANVYAGDATGYALSLSLLYSGLIWTVCSWWIITARLVGMQGHPLTLPRWLWRDIPVGLCLAGWLSALTNPWHGLFLTPVPGFRSDYGVLWYANGAVLWGLIGLVVALVVHRHRRSPYASDRAQLRLCAISVTLPTLLNATYTLLPTPVRFDPTVIGIAISTSLLVLAVYRGQLHAATTVRVQDWLDTNPLPGLLVDRHDRLLFANRSFQALLGNPPLHQPISDWLREVLGAANEWPQGARLEDMPNRVWQIDGRPDRWFEFERRPVEHGGLVVGAAWIMHDETRRVNMDAVLQSARQVESLGLIAGGVAHDFNNLLVSIMGNAELGELFAEKDPRRAREYFTRIRKAGEQGAELARQLLTYAGKGQVSLSDVDINELLRTTADLRRGSMAWNVSIALALDETTPPHALADRSQVSQILLNFVVNAEEALRAEPGNIRLVSGHARLERDELAELLAGSELEPGDYVFFRVEDNGPGISQDTLARMFDPFFSTKAVGRGLGLATTLGAIRSNRGCLQVRSTPGQGTRFTIYLPRAMARQQTTRDNPSTDLDVWQGKAAVVLDDNEAVRAVHRQMLEHLGFRLPARYITVDEAVTMANRLDLAVVDQTMPGLPGELAVQRLRAANPHLAVILASGYASGESPTASPTTSVVHLQKPFSLGSLVGAITAAFIAAVDTDEAAISPPDRPRNE